MQSASPTRGALLALLSTAMVAACTQGSTPVKGAHTALPVPAAAGSQSPKLSLGADGTLLLSWLEPVGEDHALAYAEYLDDGWSARREVARGANWFVNWADFPSVVPVTTDQFAAHWLVSRPQGGYAYDVAFSLSRDRGASWSAPIRPHLDDTATEHGFVTIYPHADGAGLVWLDGRNMLKESAPGHVVNGMTLRAAVVDENLSILRAQEVDGLICDCCQTDVTVARDGAVAVYRDRTDDEIRDIYVSRYIDGRWQPGRPLADDHWSIAACPVNGPAIDAADQRVAIAWFSAAEDRPTVKLATSNDSGSTFSLPIEIERGDVYGRVGVALAGNGDAVVSWLGKTDADRARLIVVMARSDGTIGESLTLDFVDPVAAFSVPQIEIVDDHLILAWTGESGGRGMVHSARVPLAMLERGGG